MQTKSDKPLILIHGYPFSHSLWYSTIAALGANVRVIAPDLPGFGKNSVDPNGKPTLEKMADSIAGVLNEGSVEKAVVAGMSMGGYVAVAFAEKYPSRTVGLGLISSQAAADTPEARANRFHLIGKIRDEGPQAASDAILPNLFAEPHSNSDSLREYPVLGARAAGVNGLTWALEAMAGRKDRTAFLHALDIPILVVHGLEDKIIPALRARQLAEQCRIPILVELAGVGHASPLEAPDQVARALIRLMHKCRERSETEATGK